ncbi:MAG TPA: FHA domain-containing protein [Tepidisphaeraceae bacterium]|nr:FHA domain-containing protein [Tepidisphaeraceae bacterium]
MQAVLVMFRNDGERRSFSLSREMTVIGRRQDCDLMIPLNEISRKHCRFIREGDSLRVEDLGSSNGTFCNGRRVQEAVLSPGDTVQVGPVTFVVQIDGHPTDDEIQPFGNAAAAGDDDVLEELPDEDDVPQTRQAPVRRGGGAARGLAAGAAIGAGAAAMADDDDDALTPLPDDEDELEELPDEDVPDAHGELIELPDEDDLLHPVNGNAPTVDDEPLDVLEDVAPAAPVTSASMPRRPTMPVRSAPTPPPPAAADEDELDLLGDDHAGPLEEIAAPGEPVGAQAEDDLLPADDAPLPLDLDDADHPGASGGPIPMETDEPLALEDVPQAAAEGAMELADARDGSAGGGEGTHLLEQPLAAGGPDLLDEAVEHPPIAMSGDDEAAPTEEVGLADDLAIGGVEGHEPAAVDRSAETDGPLPMDEAPRGPVEDLLEVAEEPGEATGPANEQLEEHEELLELAEDDHINLADDHAAGGHGGASEDDLLDLLGEAPKPKPDQQNHV